MTMYASCNYLETYWQRAASMRRSPLPDLPALRIVDEEPLLQRILIAAHALPEVPVLHLARVIL